MSLDADDHYGWPGSAVSVCMELMKAIATVEVFTLTPDG